jgi:murein DD-endopeptidase MepM/ murein hydrolase activator NlpD
MFDFLDTFSDKIRLFIGVLVIILGLLLLPVFLSLPMSNPKAQAASTDSMSDSVSTDDSPNIITSGLFESTDKLSKLSSSATQNVSNSIGSAASTLRIATIDSSKAVVHGVGSGVSLMADGASNGFGLMVRTTGSAVGFIGKTPPVSTIIKPSDKTPAPEIGKADPLAVKTEEAKPTTPASTPPPQPEPQVDQAAVWPIHGTITTYFGQSDMPYQRYHTGIDISDGRRSGVTPIHPFRPGRVIEVVHSNISLGNHVVVDNGGGITSVYGHMYTTNVSVGQQVDHNSVLGYEGSTGVSTGTHLHFEIRVNGQAVDPRKYISGTP